MTVLTESYFNVYWWFFTTTKPHKKHSKPKNDRSYQAHFFIIPTIKTLSYCKFSLK
ncbi:hypothetical protein HMPREF1415_01181 [Helicobacter pylori GAM254Ai]|nr:hypothetical protein HMPREF1415_01181 [Helicobacter pylori GAM254Ai]